MALKIARFVNLIRAGMLTGDVFGSWVDGHPALSNLPTRTHIQAEQAVYRRYGAIMPFFMTSTIVSAIPVLSLIRDRKSAAFRSTFAGMMCFAAMLLVTLTGKVPINRRLLDLSPQEESYEEFVEPLGPAPRGAQPCEHSWAYLLVPGSIVANRIWRDNMSAYGFTELADLSA